MPPLGQFAVFTAPKPLTRTRSSPSATRALNSGRLRSMTARSGVAGQSVPFVRKSVVPVPPSSWTMSASFAAPRSAVAAISMRGVPW